MSPVAALVRLESAWGYQVLSKEGAVNLSMENFGYSASSGRSPQFVVLRRRHIETLGEPSG